LKLSVRTKLFLVWLALIVLSMAAADAFLSAGVARPLSEIMHEDLLVRARLVAQQVASVPALAQGDYEAWSRLADELATVAGARVTLIGRDGTVFGDSELSQDELSRAGGSAPGAEVAQALDVGEGIVERLGGAQRQRRFLSAAVRFKHDGAVAGVARVTVPLDAIESATSDVRRLVWFGSGVALVLAFALSNVVARRISGALAALTAATRRMTDGDFSVRTRLVGSDDLAELGQSLDWLAASLTTRMRQLQAERDLQGRVLEAMLEGVVVVDRDGRIVLVNSALRAILLLGNDAVGRLLIETVRHAQIEELLGTAGRHGKAVAVEIDLPGIKPRRLLGHATPLSGEDEGFVVIVFVDVTDLRRLEAMRRDFVANASHELRTPIAAVQSATETLRTGALSDSRAAMRFVDIIDRNAQRLRSLLEDMLELSKLESNEFRLKRERVELGSVVPIVLALFRERAEKKGVMLQSELPPEPAAIEGDARALEHVLSNLVDNAVKYCPGGTRVVVRAVADGARVRLIVSDTGPGIPPEHLPRIFERFYRVDAGRSRELGGTGLGLSIVKHMVEAMRGKVSAESQVGKGSTFSVSLPAARVDDSDGFSREANPAQI
jgi:two-component system phosphate regulon sensor histidine kinase PhoR